MPFFPWHAYRDGTWIGCFPLFLIYKEIFNFKLPNLKILAIEFFFSILELLVIFSDINFKDIWPMNITIPMVYLRSKTFKPRSNTTCQILTYLWYHMLGNEPHFHAKPNIREEEIFNQEIKWHNKHTIHKDFTLETKTRKTNIPWAFCSLAVLFVQNKRLHV